MNGSDTLPSRFLTCRVTICPRAIFLPAFLPISIVDGFCSSFAVFCFFSSSNITASLSKFSPVMNSFLPVTEAP